MGYYDYYYNTPYGHGNNIVASSYLSFPAMILLFMVSIYVVITYVLRSIGLYHMAKSRGIAHAWFAWVPILNYYVLGRLINNKVVLGDDIVLPHADFFLPFFALLTIANSGEGVGFFVGIIAAAEWVYKMSAYWRLFKIYRPKSRTSFTVWSALIGSGFFIFAIRNDRPFDPLDPDKQYQDFYAQKKVVTDHYENVEEGIRNRQHAREDLLEQSYQDQLAQNPTPEEKEKIDQEYNVNKNYINDTYNAQVESNWREQYQATEQLNDATVEANTQAEAGNEFEMPQGSDFITESAAEIKEIEAPEAVIEEPEEVLEIIAPVEDAVETVEGVEIPKTSYTTIDTSDLEDSLAKIIKDLDNE